MKRFSLRYTLLTYRLDQLWFPLGFWSVFIILGLLRGPEHIMGTTRAYLGGVVPLIGGMMAAYAILDDPALELRFATPISTARAMFERLGMTFLIQAIGALTFQAFALALGADFSFLGNAWDVQLAWLLPTLSLMAVATLGALSAAQTMAGALLVGLVWIVQLVANNWFSVQKVGKYFLIFMGILKPTHPSLHLNQLALSLLVIAFFVISWALFNRQERYI